MGNVTHIIHQTAYAFKNNRLVHISDVDRGLACGCICVLCRAYLIAKKGELKIHHFAHVKDGDCQGAAETALHLLAKELFQELNNVSLPEYFFKKTKKIKSSFSEITHEEVVLKGGIAPITKVFLEQSENNFRPDITLECKSKRLIVEIAVTHKVDRKKMRLIRKTNLPAIEISLDLSDALLSREDLKCKLQNDLKSKIWLFHPNQREAENIFYKKLRSAIRHAKRPAITRGIANSSSDHSKQSNHLASHGNSTNNYRYEDILNDRRLYEYYLKHGKQPADGELPKLPPFSNSSNRYKDK